MLLYGSIQFPQNAWVAWHCSLRQRQARHRTRGLAPMLASPVPTRIDMWISLCDRLLFADQKPHGAAVVTGAAFDLAHLFTAFGDGAPPFAPVIARRRVWVVLEIGNRITMGSISAGLAFVG